MLKNYLRLKEIKGENLYVRYTNVDKLEINPNYEYYTMPGLYAYPMQQLLIYEHFRDMSPFFADNRKYIQVFSFTGTLLDTNHIPLNLFKHLLSAMSPYGKDRYRKTPHSFYEFKNLVNLICCEGLYQKMHHVLYDFGYDGIIDFNAMLTEDITTQLCLFSTKRIEPIKTMLNAYS